MIVINDLLRASDSGYFNWTMLLVELEEKDTFLTHYTSPLSLLNSKDSSSYSSVAYVGSQEDVSWQITKKGKRRTCPTGRFSPILHG